MTTTPMLSRADLLRIEQRFVERAVPQLELRAGSGDDGQPFEVFGYASITDHGYDLYGGPPYGWTEYVARGSFAKTLSENPKVDFLANHGGLSLASTRAQSFRLELAEDQIGLAYRALLNPDESDARDLALKLADGRNADSSFAFRVTRQRWEDLDGNEADPSTAPVRRILEVSLDRGDVSAVTNGANPAAWSAVRSMSNALDGFRRGAELSDEQRTVVQQWLSLVLNVDDENDENASDLPVVLADENSGDEPQKNARAVAAMAAARF